MFATRFLILFSAIALMFATSTISASNEPGPCCNSSNPRCCVFKMPCCR